MKRICIALIPFFISVSANEMPEIFSKSSRFEAKDPWNFSVNVAFNEYQAVQDSMELAYESSTSNKVSNGSLIVLNYDYHPGFQVGFTLNTPYDYWVLGGEFLWYQGNSGRKKTAEEPLYYLSPLFIGDSPFIRSLDANWKLYVDVADLYLSRPYYLGEKWKVVPYSGFRGSWISQTLKLDANLFDEVPTTQSAIIKSKSWGIGPRVGFRSNFLLGCGISLFGDLASSILYTRYNKIDAEFKNSLSQESRTSNNQFGSVRPNIDAGLGVEWDSLLAFSSGSYDWKKTFYLNLSASYNFSLFFAQNMGVALVSAADSSDSTPGNLYLQGLTISLAFVF